MNYFNIIPSELYFLVLFELEPFVLLNCMTISKSFEKYCNNRLLWKYFMDKTNYKKLSDDYKNDYKINFILRNFLFNHTRNVDIFELIELDLYNIHEQIPKEIEHLTALKTIHISGDVPIIINNIFNLTNLETLSVFGSRIYDKNYSMDLQNISNLSNLKTLMVVNNNIETIPIETFKLTTLQSLNLASNILQTIALEISQLKNLQKIYLGNNKLKEFPLGLCYLTDIKFIDISENNIVSIPSEIGNLVNLVYLYLHFNKIQKIPIEINCLIRLKILDLYKNNLARLPDELYDLIDCNLKKIDIRKNKIYKIPKELKDIAIKN